MSSYDFVAGDGGWILRVTIRDKDSKQKVDLTGKTVKVRWSLSGGATVQRDMVLRNQTTNPGEADYSFLTSDIPSDGELIGEVRINAGLSDQLTTVNVFHLSGRAALP